LLVCILLLLLAHPPTGGPLSEIVKRFARCQHQLSACTTQGSGLHLGYRFAVVNPPYFRKLGGLRKTGLLQVCEMCKYCIVYTTPMADVMVAGSPERRRTSDHRHFAEWPHHVPVPRQLHWLPVRHRVEFKLAVLVFKALHGLAPQYLADDCQLDTAAGWSPSTTIVRHPHVRHHPHSSWRSIIRSRWTTSVEQSTCWTSWF